MCGDASSVYREFSDPPTWLQPLHPGHTGDSRPLCSNIGDTLGGEGGVTFFHLHLLLLWLIFYCKLNQFKDFIIRSILLENPLLNETDMTF